jgi:hypothetical protein
MAARAGTKVVVVIRDSEHTYFSRVTPRYIRYVTWQHNIIVNSSDDWAFTVQDRSSCRELHVYIAEGNQK